MAAPQQAQQWVQPSLDELGEPLRETAFTVVDLETTGGSSAADAITEVGAVRVRCGEVEGEFQTLVNPGMAITPYVSVLTGITDAMVQGAPSAAGVLPAFLEFARGSVLVAHNAPFDVGFLRSACAQHGIAWPQFAVLDTALLARRVLTRDEVPNCRLATLATFFRAGTTPDHRALHDARATVDVLHALIGRLGNLGVQSLPELRAFTAQVSDAQRRKRHLADHLPSRPGVYIFRDERGAPLYVGTSRNLRSRVRQYFVASETRSRMGEMVGLANQVDHIECAHALEAHVRELRLIAAHKPRYNRRSKYPERSVWLKLTTEPFPRLSIVRERRADAAAYLGPLRSQHQAETVRDAIHDAVPLRQCSDRLSVRRVVRAACVLAGIGKCAAPCEGGISPERYSDLVERVAAAWAGDVRPLVEPLQAKLAELSDAQRFEQAGAVRDRIAAVVRACARMQRLAALRAVHELVAARPDGAGGWELSVVRQGRLAAAGTAARGVSPMPVVDALVATADALLPEDSARPGTAHSVLTEESEAIVRWLEEPGTRLVRTSHPWAMPAHGAGGLRSYLAVTDSRSVNPFADRRRLRLSARPVRASA
ncbi:MAG TPA: DEDD exonuclease domain-containing protein [Jatrophihabitantaceae bacterium]